jgi:3-deoxy-D-manno-octulosonic-acid transferase
LNLLLYNFFLGLYRAAAWLSSLFNDKAAKWVKGRKNIFQSIEKAILPGQQTVWVHCASLGEFEQGRPLIEEIRKQFPSQKILLTFFSPSGYEIRKDYKEADWVFYLPMDGARNAKRFVEIVNPTLVIFVKYEFWYYYLAAIHARKIPLLLVSGIFRKDSVFFKWYGGLHKKMLGFFDHLFLQDNTSADILKGLKCKTPFTVSGDTRFDRVTAIAESAESISGIDEFIGLNTVIIAGSTWPSDEKILKQVFELLKDRSIKLIIAPHEVDESHIQDLIHLFPSAIRYSAQTNIPIGGGSKVMIIDNIGMLSVLYRYAHIAYVGGGFEKGIHNTLEAAVYNKIVLFGPNHGKFAEAQSLITNGGGYAIKKAEDIITIISDLDNDYDEYQRRSNAAGDLVRSGTGATQVIISYIQEKRLLTS